MNQKKKEKQQKGVKLNIVKAPLSKEKNPIQTFEIPHNVWSRVITFCLALTSQEFGNGTDENIVAEKLAQCDKNTADSFLNISVRFTSKTKGRNPAETSGSWRLG